MKAYRDMSTSERIRATRVGALVSVPHWMRVGNCVKGEITKINGAYVLVRLNNGIEVEPYDTELQNFYGWASGSQPDMFKEYTNANT